MVHSTEQMAADVLRAARKLIEKPECWAQRYYFSKDAENDGAFSECYCAVGALYAASQVDILLHDLSDAPAMQHLARAIGRASESAITDWNDHPNRTHAEVLAAFDRAIALAEAAQ